MNYEELKKLVFASTAYKECKSQIKDEEKMIAYVYRKFPAFTGEDEGLTIDGLVSVYTAGKYNV